MDANNADVLASANARRSAQAAERNARIAAVLLTRRLPDSGRAVAEARAANPELGWPELAASIGLSKNQAVSVWRRLLIANPDLAAGEAGDRT